MAGTALIGAQKFTAQMDGLSKRMESLIHRVVQDAAERVAADAAISITSGSIQGKGHVRSRPGEPPNAEWGHLHTSIKVEKVDDLHWNVAVYAPYAAHLEYGTARMAARPFLRPAEIKNRDETVLSFFGAIKKARGL
ncbi:HK97-gp10 family putative phage morphogenesis protein [Methylorubrum extorquens]|uniref:Phage protein, HK97 gp10 family n=1 Tax=Methylorubrum extorquens DSM 13060 TaxID=882800 RepID=H1KGA1_METEX|nr:HK97-gp10 family putative phage morphogenesis protein [Methylorubrum extorquens]EHP93442.1 phage protein, HK97 gp10 family [Methylorubrum extorquens DSM 13060]